MKVERHGYRFTNKRDSKGGFISMILAVLALITLSVGIGLSYKKGGNAGIYVGALGTGAFILSSLGLIHGLKSFKEIDRFYLFSVIGSVSNGILWIAMCGIIAYGFMNV